MNMIKAHKICAPYNASIAAYFNHEANYLLCIFSPLFIFNVRQEVFTDAFVGCVLFWDWLAIFLVRSNSGMPGRFYSKFYNLLKSFKIQVFKLLETNTTFTDTYFA